MHTRVFALAVFAAFVLSQQSQAAVGVSGPLQLSVSNGVKTLSWPRQLIPALETNKLSSGVTVTNLGEISRDLISVTPAGYAWSQSNAAPQGYFSLKLGQMSSNKLLSANILNRLAYGPTPDDLDRIAIIGPQAYIDEQLAPETIPNPPDAYTSVSTNSASLPPSTNWTTVQVTGTVSTATLYMYLTKPGSVNLDNVQLRYTYTFTAVTNNAGVITSNVTSEITGNAVSNGDFESTLSPPWTVTASHAGSALDNTQASSGTNSLRMTTATGGTTQASSIWQALTAAPAAGTTRGTNSGTGEIWTNTISAVRTVLNFSYVPNASSRYLVIRLSGSGVIMSGTDPAPQPEWIYATASGTTDPASPFLYMYLSGAGEAWIDNVKMVVGSVPEAGANLLQNGDFDSALSPWLAVGNHSNSVVDATVGYTGTGSLRLIAEGAGSGNNTNGNSVVQRITAPLTAGQTYTISYRYRPATRNRALTVRVSGSGTSSTPDGLPGNLKRRLDSETWGVSLDEMRTWYGRNAVESPRQLLEILTQFFENHFVTYHSKTADYLDTVYDGLQDRIATDLEYREVSRWRQAMLDPNCTFYDLLKIHVESPAEIIYLDTVESRADGNRVANENYARELFELFTMGVDNGYDQNDIVAMSRAWTGWTVGLVRREDRDNPFARYVDRNGQGPGDNVMQYGLYPGVGSEAVSNIVGVWSFVYNTNWHGTNRARILSVWAAGNETNPVALGPKTYASRLGPVWSGRPYQIVIPPNRTGNSGIQDGYDVIAALSTNIYTAEYLSVKLCRIFVHDEFPNPTTRTNLAEYAYYNYANPNRTAEAELVRRCIVAWDTPGPDGRKGHLRSVLRTIFDSDLFRSHGGSRQKVKTPLEFVASAARALRSVTGGPPTAATDGNFSSPLSRMGVMSLFNRAEPDGYPEVGPPWISAGTLAERLRFVQTMCMDPAVSGGRPGDAGNNTVQPVELVQRKLLNTQWSNAGAIVDLFLGYLYPGEGQANLDLYRAAGIAFLNDGSADPTGNGTSGQSFSQLPLSTSANSSYDLRLRGMVAMLMTFQRFQEQ